MKKSGNSFAERVIALAEAIVTPSSNAEYDLLRCFDLSVMDSHPKLQWNSQRIKPKNEFLVYLSSLLLNAVSIARFEIAFKLNKDTSTGGQTLWKKVDSDLDEAVSSALNKIQSFFKSTASEEEALVSGGAIRHVRTGIEVSSKMAILSLEEKEIQTFFPIAIHILLIQLPEE